jgi:hypothetical protein
VANGGDNFNQTEPDSRMPAHGPAQGVVFVADEWNLKRIDSTESPEPLLRRESSTVRAAFATLDLIRGMPRRLAAILLGIWIANA